MKKNWSDMDRTRIGVDRNWRLTMRMILVVFSLIFTALFGWGIWYVVNPS